jgi:alpha-galactosidase
MLYQKSFIRYNLVGSKISFSNEFVDTCDDENIHISLLDENKTCALEIRTNTPIEITELKYFYTYPFDKKDHIMCNGFQSWTETREFIINEKIIKYHPLVSKFSKPFGDATYYEFPQKNGYLHAWSYAYIKKENGEIQFIASCSDADAFTLIEFHTPKNEIIISKDIKGCIIEKENRIFKLYLESGDKEIVFKNYFTATGFEYKPNKLNGWTSWYHYYTDIDEKVINENISNYLNNENYPIDIFQIDDGWQKDIGNWTTCNNKFPNGLKIFTDKLHAKNIKAGLWLAPFICEKKSEIYTKHKDWILKNDNGALVKAGYNPGWSGDFFVLDFYNVSCRKYLENAFNVILNQWGFDMLKLDFLYAVCLQSRADKTRGAIMYEAMQWIRKVCGDKLILACGVPLMPCAGVVDFCRIGPDISLAWNDFLADTFRLREGISTRKSIGNTIARKELDGYWFANDPDVFMLRNKKQKMSWDERVKLFETNTKYGSLLFTSDNIAHYNEDMKRLYSSIFRKQ